MSRLIDADDTREEVIATLRDCFNVTDEVVDTVVTTINNMTPIDPEPHWIPVTENTLPEENRVVVVCGDKGTWDFGTYRGHGTNIHLWHWKKNTYKRVYWWMYKEDALPEPYKGVTDGRD